jgi:hypothetical protein
VSECFMRFNRVLSLFFGMTKNEQRDYLYNQRTNRYFKKTAFWFTREKERVREKGETEIYFFVFIFRYLPPFFRGDLLFFLFLYVFNVDFLSILSVYVSLGDTFVYPEPHLGLFVFAVFFPHQIISLFFFFF